MQHAEDRLPHMPSGDQLMKYPEDSLTKLLSKFKPLSMINNLYSYISLKSSGLQDSILLPLNQVIHWFSSFICRSIHSIYSHTGVYNPLINPAPLQIYPSTVCPSIRPSIHLYVHLSTHSPPTYSSIYLSLRPAIQLSIHPFILLPTPQFMHSFNWHFQNNDSVSENVLGPKDTKINQVALCLEKEVDILSGTTALEERVLSHLEY